MDYSVIILLWIVMIIVSAIVGSGKKCGAGIGFVLGLFLGLIGLIIVACLEDKPTETERAPMLIPKPGVSVADSPLAHLEAIERAGKLLRENLITQEEFDTIKTKHLNA